MPRLFTILGLISLLYITSGCSDDIETEHVCIQLDSPSSRVFIRDYQFDRFRIFDIGKFGGADYLDPGDSVIAFYLFQSVGSLNPNESDAVAYPNALDPLSSPDSVSQRFRLLVLGVDYELIRDPDEGRNFIFFPEPLQNIASTTIAYHMVVKELNRSILAIGDLEGTPLRLQILKRSSPHPDDPHWESEWKNVYDLGARNIDYRELNLEIFKGAAGDESNRANLNHQNGTYYLRLLGLDSVGYNGAPPPDNKIDNSGRVLDTTRGLVIFPNSHPFAVPKLLDRVDGIYRTVDTADARALSRYYFRYTYPFELAHTDIVRGSVTVYADGVEMPQSYIFVHPASGALLFEREADSTLLNSSSIEICYEYWK